MPAVLMVHFGPPVATLEALSALAAALPPATPVYVLDNSGNLEWSREAGRLTTVQVIANSANLGFAAGMNRLIAVALADDDVDALLLLNNDTLAQPGMLEAMQAALQPQRQMDMVSARLLSFDGPSQVDSLGITLYRSGLASNRKHTSQRLLGPTGGCMLVTRRLLEDLRREHGEWFDESFFCYAEDTDLVMRARWLGYECAHADQAVVLHHGSLSSGGPDNEFVLYHGIRNSIWALAKNAPALWLLAFSPWIVTAHVAIWLRQLRKGRARTLWRLYRDALRGLGPMRAKRKLIARSRRVPARRWWRWVEPRLYERDYLRRALRDLFALGK